MFIIKKQKKTFSLAVIIFLFVLMLLPLQTLGESVQELQQKINARKESVEQLQEKVAQLQRSIDARRSQASSLANQVTILSSKIEQIETEIELTNTKIEQANLEIAKTQQELANVQDTISSERDQLASFMRVLHKLDQQDELEILLLNDSISSFFSTMETALRVQYDIQETITGLKNQKQELSAHKKVINDKKVALATFIENLEYDQLQLERQSTARTQLLAETKNSESQFQKLLKEAKAEQVRINTDIQNLEQTVRKRLETLEKEQGLKQLAGASSFIWPIPFKGITALFHDPDYPYRYIFEHPAVDLRAAQGTPIKAAAPGYVARAADRGMGYSYIMIIHADGFATVYGHVSRIFVQEDQFVNQGDIVGLTGGQPGTPGAGNLTTGSHLHFEVRKSGIPVDPLSFLSIP